MTIDWDYVLWGAIFVAVSFVVSSALVTIILVNLPRGYFLDRPARQLWVDQHPVVRVALRGLKNLAGVCLIVAGLGLSLPGIPGPGALTILAGIILLDFPGKQRFLRSVVSRPRVFAVINHIRRSFDKRPLRLPEKRR